jgi:phage terminase large subunit-like protein
MLEEEMCTYDGSGNSPDRLDAMVWAMTELTHARGKAFAAVA